MVKVCLEEFPLGSYPGQESAGYYMNEKLKDNLDIFIDKIDDDLQFVGLVTGNGTVGNGKSTVAQQIGFYHCKQMSKKLNKEIPFNEKNIVFNSDKLIERAFELPQFSCLILDEGDDLTEHYFSKVARTLKRFFRKCRQLNLFIILILPDFFELPKSYAIIRSNFLINVKFMGKFERGYYDFFGPTNKKYLYLNGKKNLDYNPKGTSPDFEGRFVNLYTISKETYKAMKYADMIEDKEEEGQGKARSPARERLVEVYGRLHEDFQIPHGKLSAIFGFSSRTGDKYYKEYKERGGRSNIVPYSNEE